MERTKLVRNGDAEPFDVRWSLLSKLALWFLGIAGTVVAAGTLAGLSLAFESLRKQDVMEERQRVVIANQESFKSAMEELRMKVIDEDYLTRTEFKDWLHSHERTDAVRAIMNGYPNREGEGGERR